MINEKIIKGTSRALLYSPELYRTLSGAGSGTSFPPETPSWALLYHKKIINVNLEILTNSGKNIVKFLYSYLYSYLHSSFCQKLILSGIRSVRDLSFQGFIPSGIRSIPRSRPFRPSTWQRKESRFPPYPCQVRPAPSSHALQPGFCLVCPSW